jgi:hypothetical protein
MEFSLKPIREASLNDILFESLREGKLSRRPAGNPSLRKALVMNRFKSWAFGSGSSAKADQVRKNMRHWENLSCAA